VVGDGGGEVGLTASVIAGVAVAAAIGGLALMANTSGSHGAAGNVRAAGAQAKGTADAAPLKIVAVSPAANTKRVGGDTP